MTLKNAHKIPVFMFKYPPADIHMLSFVKLKQIFKLYYKKTKQNDVILTVYSSLKLIPITHIPGHLQTVSTLKKGTFSEDTYANKIIDHSKVSFLASMNY